MHKTLHQSNNMLLVYSQIFIDTAFIESVELNSLNQNNQESGSGLSISLIHDCLDFQYKISS